MAVKVCFISDTHGERYTKQIQIPECDILIHCGDHSFIGREAEVRAFDAWLKTVPAKHKVITLGNHEVELSRNMDKLCEWLPTPDHILIHSSAEVMGLKIFGSPWTPEFGNWAFNYNQAEAQTLWDAIPDDTDIVFTHGPPYGFGDTLSEAGSEPGKKVGCPYLLEAIKRVKPKVHAYGHLHEGRGIYRNINSEGSIIHFINCAVLDEYYQTISEPIVIDVEPRNNK